MKTFNGWSEQDFKDAQTEGLRLDYKLEYGGGQWAVVLFARTLISNPLVCQGNTHEEALASLQTTLSIMEQEFSASSRREQPRSPVPHHLPKVRVAGTRATPAPAHADRSPGAGPQKAPHKSRGRAPNQAP